MSEKELALIARELIEAIKNVSNAQSKTADIMLKSITKILIAFAFATMMIGGCLFYCIYSIYNYENYPTIPSIQNNAISGNSNTMQEGGK